MKKLYIITAIFILMFSMYSCSKNADSLYEEGMNYFNKGYYAEAINILKDINEKDLSKYKDKTEDIYFTIGYSYMNIKRYNEAIEPLKKAYNINNNDIEIIMPLARAYILNYKYDEAEKLYKKALKLKPQSFDINHYLGIINMRKSPADLNKAAKYLKKSIKFNPLYGETYGNLAMVYLKMGNKKSAKYYLDKGISLGYNNLPVIRDMKKEIYNK